MLFDTLKSVDLYLFYLTENISMPLFYAFVGVIGLCIGSFANVVIYRSPLKALKQEHEYLKETYQLEDTGYNRECSQLELEESRSFCPSCHTRIPWFDNIPIVGWLLLRGKAKCCGASIPVSYLISEAVIPVLWVISAMLVGEVNIALFSILVTISTGYVISVIDLKHKVVLDKHATLFVASFITSVYLITNESLFTVNAIWVLIMLFLTVKSYEMVRNLLLGSSLKMMGEGDWSLWYALCCIGSSIAIITDNGLQVGLVVSILVFALSMLTILGIAMVQALAKGSAKVESEFPAAPAIVGASVVLLLSLIANQLSLFF